MIIPSFEANPSGRANIVPDAVGLVVPVPMLTAKDVWLILFVITKEPLYWVCATPAILIFLSAASPCALVDTTVAIPEVKSYAIELNGIESPVSYKNALVHSAATPAVVNPVIVDADATLIVLSLSVPTPTVPIPVIRYRSLYPAKDSDVIPLTLITSPTLSYIWVTCNTACENPVVVPTPTTFIVLPIP